MLRAQSLQRWANRHTRSLGDTGAWLGPLQKAQKSQANVDTLCSPNTTATSFHRLRTFWKI